MKTLKEMMGNATDSYPRSWVMRDELKQSAIEDIKELQNQLCENNHSLSSDYKQGKIYPFFCEHCIGIQRTIEYIKEKFNITDEDLK